MIRSNGTGQDGDASGSHRTPRLQRAGGSVSQLRRPRRLRGPRLAWTPRLSRRSLSTVWPCAQGGTGPLADWLLTAVVKIVTLYTEPGQRVLLLIPPIARRTTFGAVDAERCPGRDEDLYAGLREAARTVVRLGRSVQVHTAGSIEAPTDGSVGSPTTDCLATLSGPSVRIPESASHVDGASPDPVDIDRSDSNSPTGPTSRLVADLSDRFDLVITTVDPHASNWARSGKWDRLLTAQGTLTVITHSDRRVGRLTDPTGSLVHRIRETGLVYLDHAALLRVPVRHSSLDAGTNPTTTHHRVAAGTTDAPPAPTQVHSDLLVFARAAAATVTSVALETSDV